MSRRTGVAERLIFGLLFLAMTWIGLLTLTRPWLEASLPALYHDGQPPLVGVQAVQPKRTAGLVGVWNGSLQRAADAATTQELPYRSLFVRFFNEALFRTFAASYMNHGTLVFGSKHTLFEQLYIEAYCGLRQEADRAPPEAFARRVRVAQDWFASRGQRLIYAIVPAKTTWYSDRIGNSLPCMQDRIDRNYPAAIRALTAAGVTFVDGRAALNAFRGSGVELFPRNGTHWNQLGATIFADALIEALQHAGVQGVPRLHYTVTTAPRESGSDVDLINLANLLWTPDGVPAPLVQFTPPKIPGTLRFASVNDSFMFLPASILFSGEIFRQIDFYYYFRIFHRRYPETSDLPVDPARAEDVAPIFNADVILLEEVEARWGGPLATGFLDEVDKMRPKAIAERLPN